LKLRFRTVDIDEWIMEKEQAFIKNLSTKHPETSSVTIVPLGYRARCAEVCCGNIARLLLRYADASGRPISHPALCHEHARVRLARNRAAGFKVYYERGTL
jgi:hypothetical protein